MVRNFFVETKKLDFQVRFKKCDPMFYVIRDEGRDHGNQTACEDENGSTTKALMNFAQNMALYSKHQNDERDNFDHVIEVFFAGKGKRGILTHAFLSESMKKT